MKEIKEETVVTGETKLEFARAFIVTLYNLFSRWQKKAFVGSYEQARLILQLHMKRFIPMAILKNAFQTLIHAGLIKETKKTIKFGPIQIGDKFFKATDQRVYLALPVDDLESLLEQLVGSFRNVYYSTKELASREDIEMLRSELEKKRSDLPWDLVPSAIRDYSDIDILYSYPRSDILYYTNIIKAYDPIAEKARQRREREPEERREKEYESNLNKAIVKAVDLCIKTTFVTGSEVLILDMPMLKETGFLNATDISYEDGILTVTQDSFSVPILAQNIDVINDKNEIRIRIGNQLCGITYIPHNSLILDVMMLKSFIESTLSNPPYW